MAGRELNMMYVNQGPEKEHVYEPYDNYPSAGQSTPPPGPLANPAAQVAEKTPEKKTNKLIWLTLVTCIFIFTGLITTLFVRLEIQNQSIQQEISLQKTKTDDITAGPQNETALLRKQVSDMQDTIPNHTELSGRLRLSSGNSSNEGRVEVQIMGLWGTICNRKWGREESEVVCRELRKSSPTAWGTHWNSTRLFGAGNGPIWMTDVRCNGNEAKITDCLLTLAMSSFRYRRRFPPCEHDEDVGVRCGH